MLALAATSCQKPAEPENRNLSRAKATMAAIYANYGVEDSFLLRENYPFNEDYRAGYLASEEQARPNPYSYLWPFSGTLSADPGSLRLAKRSRIKGSLSSARKSVSWGTAWRWARMASGISPSSKSSRTISHQVVVRSKRTPCSRIQAVTVGSG